MNRTVAWIAAGVALALAGAPAATQSRETGKQFDVDGVGVFLLLTNEAKYAAEVPMTDMRPDAVLASFIKTLPEFWDARKGDAKAIVWQTDLAAAREAAAKDGRPIAAVVVKVTEPKPLPAPHAPLL